MNKQIIQFRYGINPKLKELVLLWKMHNNYKGYFIIGPKNSGKTAFLKDLEKALDKTTYITGHQMIERLYDDVRKNRLYFFSNNPQEVLLIDDLDELDQKITVTEEIIRRLRREEYNSEGKKRLIICTFSNEEIAIQIAQRLKYDIVFFKPFAQHY